MTLTVRLPQPLEKALEEYSTSTGVSKSHVVQEALAHYMVQVQRHADAGKPAAVSANYAALRKTGLLGSVHGMRGQSATKDVVRKKVAASLKGR